MCHNAAKHAYILIRNIQLHQYIQWNIHVNLYVCMYTVNKEPS